MSTNYFLRHRPAEPCPTCGHCDHQDDLMIGHSAGGWVFLWRGYTAGNEATGGVALTKPSEWFTYLAEQLADGSLIVDSYDKTHTFGDFLSRVVYKRLPHNGRQPRRRADAEIVHPEGDDLSFSEFWC